jgi:xylulokinase
MTLVAGIDSSTQSYKVLVVDAASGTVVRDGRAAHPDGTKTNPRHRETRRGWDPAGGRYDRAATGST